MSTMTSQKRPDTGAVAGGDPRRRPGSTRHPTGSVGNAPPRPALGRQPGRRALGRRAGAHSAGDAVDQRQASQAESGGRRRLDEDLSQSPVRFPGRREGEWPPFGQTSRPCALELLRGRPSCRRSRPDVLISACRASPATPAKRGIAPPDVDDSTIEGFIATVRAETLHRKPNDLHRKVAQIWNEAAERSTLGLQSVQVPSFKHPPQRVDWSTLSDSFHADVERYLDVVCRDRHVRDRCPAACHGAANRSIAP